MPGKPWSIKVDSFNFDTLNFDIFCPAVGFVNRRRELGRVAQLARAVQAGAPERHLAMIGIRRIGKSKILEHYLGTAEVATVAVAMDDAATTLQTFLVTMLRESVSGLCRFAGRQPLRPTATLSDVAAAAAVMGEEVAAVTNAAIDLATSRRADGHLVFRAAVTFPEEVARASGKPVLVLADEFQHILDLSTYPPFRRGGGPISTRAHENVLKVFRAAVERRPHVGWVITGSSVRLLQNVFGKGPLMGRFDILEVERLDAKDCVQLATEVWEEDGVAGSEAALDRLCTLTGGHPFYADVTARQAALDALRLDVEVSPDLVDRAFLEAVHDSNGAIAIACQEMWESIRQHVPGLRGLLQALARRGEASVLELAEEIGLASAQNAFRYITELDQMGLVEKAGDGRFRVVDDVFRYWIVMASNPLAARPQLGDPLAARRAVKRFEEAYLRERSDRGRLVEGYVRDIVRNFGGQRIDGRRLGAPGVAVAVPAAKEGRRVTAFDAAGDVFGFPTEVELDVAFGDAETWLVEIRDRTRRATVEDVELLHRKAALLRSALGLAPGPAWLISMSGMDAKGRARARELGVYVSGKSDMDAIQAATGTLRP